MSVINLITKNASKVVEAGGLHWKLKRVRSRDVLRAGLATMVQFAPEDIADIMGDDTSTEQTEQLAATWAQRVAAMSDVQQAKLSDSLDALVCAGVVEASEDGETWEPIRFTLDDRQVDADKSVLSVDSLPWPVRQELAAAVQLHSREGMEAEVQAVATFREGADVSATG